MKWTSLRVGETISLPLPVDKSALAHYGEGEFSLGTAPRAEFRLHQCGSGIFAASLEVLDGKERDVAVKIDEDGYLHFKADGQKLLRIYTRRQNIKRHVDIPVGAEVRKLNGGSVIM